MATKPTKKTTKEENGNCFIIMPITTPPGSLPSYRDDDSHFKHVLECLFVPAIEGAGLTAIPPIAKGAELIQSRTIKHIEEASLVLCDISTLNPNVFFELGIRTALNKPVCLVMDDITDKIPFDTGVINHHKYKYSLSAWEIEEEIEKLHKHITDSRKTSAVDNELWKHFGFSSIAQPPKERAGTNEILKYLTSQIESLRKDLITPKGTWVPDIPRDFLPNYLTSHPLKTIWMNTLGPPQKTSGPDIQKLIDISYMDFLDRLRTTFERVEQDPFSKAITVYSKNDPPSESEKQLLEEGSSSRYGFHMKLVKIK